MTGGHPDDPGLLTRAAQQLTDLLRAKQAFLSGRLFPQLVGLIPAVFLVFFLRRLGGSSLWIPTEWRVVVDGFGLTLGLTAFNLARAHKADLEAAAAESSGEAPSTARTRQIRNLQRSMALFLGSVVLVAGYQSLRGRCVVSFEPGEAFQENQLASFSTKSDVPPDVVARSLRYDFLELERKDMQWRGTLLLPINPSEGFEKFVQVFGSQAGMGSVAGIAEHNTSELIDLLKKEMELGLLKWTSTTFFALLLGAVLLASAGFGYAYEFGEELIESLFGGLSS